MTYSVSTTSKASSDASASTTTTLVNEATSLLFATIFAFVISAVYDVSTPAIIYAPSIIFVTGVYVYAAAVKIFASVVALVKWLVFKFLWIIVVNVATVIDKAVWSILSVEEAHTVADSTTEESVKSVDNVKPTTKRVRWNPTNEIQYIKPASEMTREEKDAMGYNSDYLTKWRLKHAPEPMTPDAPRKASRGPRLVIGLPTVLFSDEKVDDEEVEGPVDTPFTTDDDYDDDDYDSIGTLSDLDLWDEDSPTTNDEKIDVVLVGNDCSDEGVELESDTLYSATDVSFEEKTDDDGGDDGGDGDDDDESIDGENEEEEESSESEVDANDDLAMYEDESGGSDDDGTELEAREDFKTFNLFQKFDAIEDEAKDGNGVTSFGSKIVNENGRNVRRSRRNR